jgi:hypothetical protein
MVGQMGMTACIPLGGSVVGGVFCSVHDHVPLPQTMIEGPVQPSSKRSLLNW